MDIKALSKKYGIPAGINGTGSIDGIHDNKVSFLADARYIKFLKPDKKAVIFTTQDIYEKIKSIRGNTYIVVKKPHQTFVEFHNLFHKDFRPFNSGNERPAKGKGCIIDDSVKFGKNVRIGNKVLIHPHSTIGSNVKIGDGTIVCPSVAIYDNVSIGRNCKIDSNASIGGEGFSSLLGRGKRATRLTNIGGVEIGDDVEIGSSTCIDRASFAFTRIGNRVKIDNLVHVAHNVAIGDDTRIAALSCLGGSCRVGKRVWISIGCSIREHVIIGDDCQILMNAVLIESVKNGQRIGGFYAMPHKSWKLHIEDVKKRYSK